MSKIGRIEHRRAGAPAASWLFTGAAAIALLAPSPAAAQESDRSAAEGPADGNDIVVTANRRAELLQDVPIAISAFQQDDVRALGADRLQGLVRVMPNVTLYDDRGAGQPTWVIRGVGLADFNPNNTPTAAVFYDEIYLPSNAMSGMGLFDIGRIEVLKGPQGGLYGRNTSGGAIRLISQAPEIGKFGGYVDAAYGSWNSIQVQGAVNVPLGTKAALRISAMTDQGGGWQDSLATPQDDNHGDKDFLAVRGQLLLQPSDGFSLLIKLDAGRDKSETLLGRVSGTENLGAASGFCAPVLAGQLDDANCGTWADRNLRRMGQALGPRPSDQADNASVVLSNPINRIDNKWIGVTAQATADLGFATLTAIGGYVSYDYRQLFDYDGSQLALAEENSDVHFDVFSQELRLTSNSDGPFNWLVGAAYNYDKIDDARDFSLRDNIIAAPPPVNAIRRTYLQSTEAFAVYGNAGYDISDALRIHGSLRYTDETKRMYNASLLVPSINLYLFRNQQMTLKLKDNLSGDFGIDLKPRSGVLLYAKATKGYKSGGFFGGVATDPGALAPYTEENIWSYEAGFKTDWAGGFRANGAVFYYDYSDRQGYLNKLNPLTNMTAVLLGNVGDVGIHGAELELSWSPPTIPGLTLQLNPAYLKGKIKDSAATSVTITGRPYSLEGLPVNTPRWSVFAAASYETPVSDTLKAGLSVNYAWRKSPNPSARYTSNDLVTYALYHIPNQGSMDARLTLGEIDGKWQIALEGRNLTDASFPTVATRDSGGSYMRFFNQPRNFRIRASYSF